MPAAPADQRTSFPGFMIPSTQRVKLRGRAETLQLGDLHLADAVLGRDRSARRRHQVVHKAGDLGTFPFVPAVRGMAAGAHVEMDVAVAEMPEPAGDHPGEGTFDLG